MLLTCMSACNWLHWDTQGWHTRVQVLIGTNISIHRSAYLAPVSNVADSFVVSYPFYVIFMLFFLLSLFVYSTLIKPHRSNLRRMGQKSIYKKNIWTERNLSNFCSKERAFIKNWNTYNFAEKKWSGCQQKLQHNTKLIFNGHI